MTIEQSNSSTSQSLQKNEEKKFWKYKNSFFIETKQPKR